MILDEFAPDLKSSLNLSYLLPHLMKRKLLTTSEEHKLKSQAKTNHDSNSEFIDYLKTKGSRAFSLFLTALRDETEHLGHLDLYERMYQRAKSAGISIRTALETSASESLDTTSVGDAPVIHHTHSTSEPRLAGIRRGLSDSSVESHAQGSRSTKLSPVKVNDSATLNFIVKQLDRIEKAVMTNQSEIVELRKVCDKLMLVKPELDKFLSQYDTRPNSRGSRPGSSGMEGDCSSGGSEISLAPMHDLQRKKQLKKRHLTPPRSKSSDSLHSAQEEISNLESYSALALPPIPPPPPQVS